MAGIAIGNVSLPAAVRRYFPHRLGVMTGLYTMAMQLGSAAAAGGTTPLADAGGSWRAGLGVWALPAVLALTPWIIALRGHSRDGRVSTAPGEDVRQGEPRAQPPCVEPGGVLRTAVAQRLRRDGLAARDLPERRCRPEHGRHPPVRRHGARRTDRTASAGSRQPPTRPTPARRRGHRRHGCGLGWAGRGSPVGRLVVGGAPRDR